MIGLLQRLFVFCVTLYVVTLVGNWLEPNLRAGHWWALGVVAVGGLTLGYVVADPDEKQEFRDAPRQIAVWFLNRPAHLANRMRSYLRRG